MKDRIYSDEELKTIIQQVSEASNEFYYKAARTGCHALIEFCGLMNEFVQMCRMTMEAGEDFTMANTHSGHSLKAQDYQIKYLAEKLDCIYGPVLSDPRNRDLFCLYMGWHDLVSKPDRSGGPITTNEVIAHASINTNSDFGQELQDFIK
jgi:hypothetical protein